MQATLNKIYGLLFKNKKILFFVALGSLAIIYFLTFIYDMISSPEDAFRSILVLGIGILLMVGLIYCSKSNNKELAKMIFFFFSGYIVLSGTVNQLSNSFFNGAPAQWTLFVLFGWFLAIVVIGYLAIFILNHFFNFKQLQLVEDYLGLAVPVFIILYYIFTIVYLAWANSNAWISFITPLLMIPAFFLFPLFRFFIEGFNGQTEEKPAEEAPTEESKDEEVVEPEVLDSDMELEEKPAQVKREEE